MPSLSTHALLSRALSTIMGRHYGPHYNGSPIMGASSWPPTTIWFPHHGGFIMPLLSCPPIVIEGKGIVQKRGFFARIMSDRNRGQGHEQRRSPDIIPALYSPPYGGQAHFLSLWLASQNCFSHGVHDHHGECSSYPWISNRDLGSRSLGLGGLGTRSRRLRDLGPKALGPRSRRLRDVASKDLAPESIAPGGVAPRGLRPEGLRPEGLRPGGTKPGGIGGLGPKGLRPKGLGPARILPITMAPITTVPITMVRLYLYGRGVCS